MNVTRRKISLHRGLPAWQQHVAFHQDAIGNGRQVAQPRNVAFHCPHLNVQAVPAGNRLLVIQFALRLDHGAVALGG